MTLRIVSIVTAAHAPSIPYIGDAYESVRDQVVPEGWALEWVVQLDGVELDALPAEIVSDPITRVASMEHAGEAAARNCALTRSTGKLIKTLDADDRLLPGAIHRDVSILANDLTISWTACRALDLLPGGELVDWEHQDPSEGRKPAGWVLEYWLSHDGLLPILPGTVCIRRSLITAMGGWMALNSSEDTGMLIPATSVADGYFIATPGLLYRQHSEQTTAQEHHVDEESRMIRHGLIAERAHGVIALMGGRSREWPDS